MPRLPWWGPNSKVRERVDLWWTVRIGILLCSADPVYVPLPSAREQVRWVGFRALYLPQSAISDLMPDVLPSLGCVPLAIYFFLAMMYSCRSEIMVVQRDLILGFMSAFRDPPSPYSCSGDSHPSLSCSGHHPGMSLPWSFLGDSLYFRFIRTATAQFSCGSTAQPNRVKNASIPAVGEIHPNRTNLATSGNWSRLRLREPGERISRK